MPRTDEANRLIRAEQRERILHAAAVVFARKGPSATIDDVAAEASISHGLAYRYFASKDAILRALLEQVPKEPYADLQSQPGSQGTPGARLTQAVVGLVESRRHPEWYQLLARALGDEATPGELRELIHRRGQAVEATLRKLIVAAQASQEVAAGDPDQLLRAVLAGVDGLIRWADYHPDEYQDHFPEPEIFLRMLRP